MYKASILIVSTSVLVGCASGPNPLQLATQSLPESQRGYIAGTYSVDCNQVKEHCIQAYSFISVYYRQRSNLSMKSSLDWVAFGWGDDSAHDFLDRQQGKKGYHFCIALPPGAYEFHSIAFYNSRGGGNGYFMRESDYFSLPFEVKQAEVLNIGRIHVSTQTGKNVLGLRTVAPGLMALFDSSADEFASARAKCPTGAQSLSSVPGFLRMPTGQRSPFVQEVAR